MPERIGRLIDKIRKGEGARPPLVTRIDDTHVDVGHELGQAFRPNDHYFTVRLNEMFLQYKRRWFAHFLPMTWVLTEYTYGYGEQALPCMVGPSMIQGKVPVKDLPEGMLFRNIRVAGTQPYRGGPLSLSVILYQVPIRDDAKRLLSALQSATSALDFSGQLGPYLKVIDAMADTASDLLDLDETKPLIGSVDQYDPDAGDIFRPGFFAMVADNSIGADTLWVRDKKLLVGADAASAKELRSSDYVLYSIMQTDERSDAESLAFIEPLRKRIIQFASRADDTSWEGAKSNLIVLGEELSLSSELTEKQAGELYERYEREMLEKHERATDLAHRGEAPPMDSDLVVMRNIVSRVRDLD